MYKRALIPLDGSRLAEGIPARASEKLHSKRVWAV